MAECLVTKLKSIVDDENLLKLGELKVEALGELFANPNRQASSNYGIGSDGRIAMFVEEADRSWCTSSKANDNRAITIEVANITGSPNYNISSAASAITFFIKEHIIQY